MTNHETFTFDNASELRDFLNQFKTTDLETVYFTNSDGPMDSLTFHTEFEVLTDGSQVQNLRVSA